MTQGRPKGSKGEIEVAKILEPWWAAHEPLAPDGNAIRFVRTPLSGGWGGKDTRSGFRASGDLMTTAAGFPFSVEVKRREGWSWAPLFRGRKSPVWGWWRQAVEQAREMSSVPLLWFRKNREPWHVLLPAGVALGRFEIASPCSPGLAREAAPVDYMFRGGVKQRWRMADFAWGVDLSRVVPLLVTAEAFLSVSPRVWEAACRRASAK